MNRPVVALVTALLSFGALGSIALMLVETASQRPAAAMFWLGVGVMLGLIALLYAARQPSDERHYSVRDL